MISATRSALVRIPPELAAQGLLLRPETPADDPFLLALYATTRQAELDQVADWPAEQKQAFVAMQFNAQRQHYRHTLTNVAFDVIERDGTPIGRLYTQEGETMLHIVDILIDPAERGAGIGTALLECLTIRPSGFMNGWASCRWVSRKASISRWKSRCLPDRRRRAS